METKLVINDPKSGKSYQKAMDSASFIGKKIGDAIPGNMFGLNDYELQITGGSDNSGVPMRSDIPGTGRKRILLVSGIGLKKKRAKGCRQNNMTSSKSKSKGIKVRKLVAGNTVSNLTAQINLRITKNGAKDITEIFGKTEAQADMRSAVQQPKLLAQADMRSAVQQANLLEQKPVEAGK